MRLKLTKPRIKGAREIAGLLLLTVMALFVQTSFEGILGQSGFRAAKTALGKLSSGIKQKIEVKWAVAGYKSTNDLSLVVSLSLVRFDLKQNLHTWPVLSGDLERSPPASYSV